MIACKTAINAVIDDSVLALPKIQSIYRNSNFSVLRNTKSVFQSVKRIVRKGENSGYQHFLHSLQSFKRPSLSGLFKQKMVKCLTPSSKQRILDSMQHLIPCQDDVTSEDVTTKFRLQKSGG